MVDTGRIHAEDIARAEERIEVHDIVTRAYIGSAVLNIAVPDIERAVAAEQRSILRIVCVVPPDNRVAQHTEGALRVARRAVNRHAAAGLSRVVRQRTVHVGAGAAGSNVESAAEAVGFVFNNQRIDRCQDRLIRQQDPRPILLHEARRDVVGDYT